MLFFPPLDFFFNLQHLPLFVPFPLKVKLPFFPFHCANIWTQTYEPEMHSPAAGKQPAMGLSTPSPPHLPQPSGNRSLSEHHRSRCGCILSNRKISLIKLSSDLQTASVAFLSPIKQPTTNRAAPGSAHPGFTPLEERTRCSSREGW